MAEAKKATHAKKHAEKAKKAVKEKTVAKTKQAVEKHPAKKHVEKTTPAAKKHVEKETPSAEKTKPAKETEKTKEKHAEKGKEKHAEKGKEKHAEKAKTAKKPYVKKKPVKITKSKEIKKLSALVRAKKRHMFRGRFGKRSVRKVSREKWQKWRKPRGIDIVFKKEDGLVPGTGYMTPKKIRFIHPSGYKEKLVRNMNELVAMEKEKGNTAVKISRTIGKKKKTEILKKADELKIVVLNR